MTRDELFKLASQSGMLLNRRFVEGNEKFTGDCLERFAALVAAAEREACAKACLLELRDPVVTWQFKLGHMEGKIDCYNAICARRRQYDPR